MAGLEKTSRSMDESDAAARIDETVKKPRLDPDPKSPLPHPGNTNGASDPDPPFVGGRPTTDWSFELISRTFSVDPVFTKKVHEFFVSDDPHLFHKMVFVRNFGWDAPLETLRQAFEGYGDIVDCAVVTGRTRTAALAGGVGFILFKTHASAMSAIKDPHKVINGLRTHTQLPFPTCPCVTVHHSKYTAVYANIISIDFAQWAFPEIREMFASYGQLLFGPLLLQLPSNTAIIIYRTPEEAAAAICEPNKTVSGCQVRCYAMFEDVLQAAKKQVHDKVEAVHKKHGTDTNEVYVRHIHDDLDDDEMLDEKLRAFLSAHGEIVAGPIPFLPEEDCSWEFALFIYKTSAAAEKALEHVIGALFEGYPLTCSSTPDHFVEEILTSRVDLCLEMVKGEQQHRAECAAHKEVLAKRAATLATRNRTSAP